MLTRVPTKVAIFGQEEQRHVTALFAILRLSACCVCAGCFCTTKLLVTLFLRHPRESGWSRDHRRAAYEVFTTSSASSIDSSLLVSSTRRKISSPLSKSRTSRRATQLQHLDRSVPVDFFSSFHLFRSFSYLEIPDRRVD